MTNIACAAETNGYVYIRCLNIAGPFVQLSDIGRQISLRQRTCRMFQFVERGKAVRSRINDEPSREKIFFLTSGKRL